MRLSAQFKSTLLTSVLSALFTVLALVLFNYVVNHNWNLFYKSNAQPFTVDGTATVKAAPDKAEIFFSVTKTAPKLQDAKDEANKATNAMVNAVEKLGINKKDIKTTNYNSYPNYADTPIAQPNTLMMPMKQDMQTILNYTVNQSITISISDQEKVNVVIDEVTKLGAENISGPNYTFSETTQKQLQQEARVKAIADAKQKAQDLAKASGMRLGKLISVQEGSNGYMSARPMLMDTKMQAGGMAASAPTQINPGENELTTNVTLSYETY